MQIDGIVFDKDGTLFDFHAVWSRWARSLLGDLFGARAAEVGRVLGFDMDSLAFAPDSPIIAETTESLARTLLVWLPGWTLEQVIDRMRIEVARTPLVSPVPLRPLFAGLRARGILLGIATNDDESSAHRNLETAGVADLFTFVAGYDSGFGAKPGPGQVQGFLAQTGLGAGRVVMVGDSRHDLTAGRAAGVATIGVLTGPALAGDLEDLADVVLPDISHIPAWLDRLGSQPQKALAAEV